MGINDRYVDRSLGNFWIALVCKRKAMEITKVCKAALRSAEIGPNSIPRPKYIYAAPEVE